MQVGRIFARFCGSPPDSRSCRAFGEPSEGRAAGPAGTRRTVRSCPRGIASRHDREARTLCRLTRSKLKGASNFCLKHSVYASHAPCAARTVTEPAMNLEPATKTFRRHRTAEDLLRGLSHLV